MALPNSPGICPGVAKLSQSESQRPTALLSCPGVCPSIPAYFSQPLHTLAEDIRSIFQEEKKKKYQMSIYEIGSLSTDPKN